MIGQLLTARQVGELLGIAPGTVLRWTRSGDLPAIKLPSGAVRYEAGQFEAWLRARATPGNEVAEGPPTTTSPDAALAPEPLTSVVPPTTTEEE